MPFLFPTAARPIGAAVGFLFGLLGKQGSNMKGMLMRFQYAHAVLPVLLTFASYRFPMPVTELKIFPNGSGQSAYYVCPRCRITMERECMSFCDRCGHRLYWSYYENTRNVYFRPHFKSSS